MDIAAYLNRIHYVGPLTRSEETLRSLQLAHLFTVPFENLSIHLGEPIVLNHEALFRKVVERRRGGFCYECNGLFAGLLQALDFDVTMLSAEVAGRDDTFGPPFDHMTLMVNLDQRWLVDVGFGDSFREPLLLDESREQVQDGRAYKLDHGQDCRLLLRREKEQWVPQYRFTLEPHRFEDFAAMCRYHQTSPASHFTQKRICSLLTAEGRITLSDMRFIESPLDGEKLERTVSEDEYRMLLQQRFGIALPQSLGW